MSMVLASVATSIARHHLLQPQDTVLVAFSGGPDSVVLLHALKRLGYAVACAHLDHGWREESAAEAAWIAERCHEWNVPLHMERAALSTRSEEAAREARLHFLQRVAEREGCGAVALGHHADDQAETLLFRLARGTGPAGAGAMAYRRLCEVGPPLIRPMLALPRSAIEAALKEWGLAALCDPSNANVAYARNRLRRDALPALKAVNGEAMRHISAFCEMMHEEEELRQEETLRLANYLVRSLAPGLGEVDRTSLLALPRVKARRVVRLATQAWGAPVWDAAQVEEVLRVADVGGRVSLRGGWQVYVDKERLVLDGNYPSPLPIPFQRDGLQRTRPWGWDIQAHAGKTERALSPTRVAFDATALPEALCWRGAEPESDAFTPWGHRQERSLAHFLSRAGIASHRQRTLLVLASDIRIWWVVGVRRGAPGALAPDAQEVVEMQATASFHV